MSRLGARHVRPSSLDPGLETGQVQFWDLTRVKAQRSDMSGLGAKHVRDNSLEPGKGAG
jgi:hypothetical protein